ncbi:hypothetical protein EMPG_15367 [Blastomyces silverae]|uniref:PH-like domain-containing protein n=1 Tax=Blastomyces silverae TaxID=2060906 RepID=A0A0H1BDJ6_9EURO|nr:hypothetical protein EMPG_15367 [Blastomyces silverae]
MAVPDETAAATGRKSSLGALVVYLQEATSKLRGNDLLIIPLDTVNGFLASFDRLDEVAYPDLIALFDGENKGNCSRLDLVSFHCMLHILLRAPPCRARDRGFYLFLKSMRYLTDSIQNSQQYTMVVASRQRKSLIGQKAFKHLLHTFVSGDVDAPRQWSGQFILELIRKSKDNGGMRKLGATVLSEPDYFLRLLAGVIIQAMVASQREPGILWPPSTPQPVLEMFSSGAPIDSHWIEKFNGFVSSQDKQQKTRSQRMHAVQTINIEASDIGHSNCSIGVLVSSLLRVMITEDNRFQFMEIRLGHIDKLVLHERTATLDVYLCVNGFYMTNGLMEKADKVSMVFENQSQGIEVRDGLQQQCRFVEGANGGFRATNGFSNLARSCPPHEKQDTSPESFLCKTGVVKDLITLPLDVGKSTAQNPRRKGSFAAIVFSFDEEAINGSSAHLDLSVPGNLNEGDQDKPHPEGEQCIINNKDCSGSVGSEYCESYPPWVSETPEPGNPLGSRSHSQERNPSPQIAPNAVNQNQPKTQDISCNGEGVVEPHISQGQGDCHFGLPSLARQALQLQPQPHNSRSFANVPGQEDQVVGNSLDLGGLDVEEASLTADNPATESERLANILVEDSPPNDRHPGPFNPTNMGQQINVPVKPTSEKKNGVEVPNQTASSSKLKRPHNRISESRANQLTVDWDQDLRVEDTLVGRPASSSKKQKRTPPQLKGPTKTSKPKSVSRSSKKKKKPEQTLDLTPHIAPTSAKSKTKKTGRQVTKTLTSARQRRAAAEKANQKLALANEFENAAYDVDDPIESSLPEESILAANQGNWTGSTAVISSVVTSEDAHVQVVRSIEGVVNPSTSRPVLEVSNLATSPEVLGPNQATAKEANSPPVCLTGEEDADQNLDLQGSNIAARESSPSAGPVEVDNSGPPSNMDIAHRKTGVECRENSWGKRLSEALARAGILSSNSLIAVSNVNGADCQARKDVSEISKNVSQFIARQAVVGQLPSSDEHDKLDHAKSQLAENAGAPVKVARPNDGAYQSVLEGDQHETQSTKLKIQGQPSATAEIRGILMPESNCPNNVEGNKSGSLPETARALRKVQIVGFDSNGPKNQCTISGGAPGRNLTKADTSTHENHNNEDFCPTKDCLENCSDDRIDEIDDMDEVSMIPTSECRRLEVGSQNGDVGSHIHSSSVCEVTEVEFRSQGRAVQSIPSQSQRVDENGSPQPLRRKLRAKGPTSNILPDVELPIDSTSGASQPLELSASSSGEDVALNNRISTSSDSERIHVDLKRQGFATNDESHDSSNSETSPQRRDAPFKQQGENMRSFAARNRSNLMDNSFWRRSAPSTFAGRLRGQQKTKQNKKSQRNKKGHKYVWTMKKAPRKSNIMPFIESSSELEHDINSSEAEVYNTESRYWDTADASSGSSSNLSYTLVEEYRDVESEWQNALRATQKTSLDILLDTSSRLIRHLLDEEQAITKVVDAYKKGGSRLIEQLRQRYDEELQECETRLLPIKEELIERCEVIMARLISDRQSFLKRSAMKDLSAAVHKRKKLLGRIDVVMKEYETDD